MPGLLAQKSWGWAGSRAREVVWPLPSSSGSRISAPWGWCCWCTGTGEPWRKELLTHGTRRGARRPDGPADWSEQRFLPAGESLRLLDDDTAHLQVVAVQGGGSGRRRQGLAPHPGHRSVLRPARHLHGLVCFSTGSEILMPLFCSRRFAKEAACPDLQTFQPRHTRLSRLQRVHNRDARRSEGEKPGVHAVRSQAARGRPRCSSGSGTLARARKSAGEQHMPALPEAAGPCPR